MKVLLVTEKCSQSATERDGGARLVETLQSAFGASLSIMQFGPKPDHSATWHYDYLVNPRNRFDRRIANARFIAERVKAVEDTFTHVIFVHVSMQFGLTSLPLKEEIHIWTFPMFLTPSYVASGEEVPEAYFDLERLCLACAKNILTPSHLEKRQLVEVYSVPEERIHVIPRGVNARFLNPKVRSLDGPLRLCSIGSIKPQKNTLGLIRLFAKVQARYPGATLQIIGPIQNTEYYAEVCTLVDQLGLGSAVELLGYVSPDRMPMVTQEAHLHISASNCETFGRSIFETLALGLPNIARKTGNAAAEFLEHLPYARFVDEDEEALDLIEELLPNLAKLSSLAVEIGELYDDELLSQLLIAKICQHDPIAISDFDGTLYHKEDSEKTARCVEAFRGFSRRIVCSARPIHDLLDQLRLFGLEVDWIVGFGGAVVTDGGGKQLWQTPLEASAITALESLSKEARRIEFENEVLQIALPPHVIPEVSDLRVEVYQGTAFVAHWQASKLRAIHRLLRHIQWSGQVRTFGDGIYDHELLTYFDGTLITPLPKNRFEKEEISYV